MIGYRTDSVKIFRYLHFRPENRCSKSCFEHLNKSPPPPPKAKNQNIFHKFFKLVFSLKKTDPSGGMKSKCSLYAIAKSV